jgi:protein-disulfide isomerase
MRIRLALPTAAILLAAFPVIAQEAMPAPFADSEIVVPPTQSSPFTEAERTALHAEIRQYLLGNPELLMEMIQLLEQKQQAEGAQTDQSLVAANAAELFDDGFSFVGGNPEGGLTIVEFLDYQCGYCRRAQPEVSELIAADGDIRLIVKEMPILGPGSDLAARAAVATLISQGTEAYATLHDRLMLTKGEITDAILDKALAESGLDSEAVRIAMDDPEVDRRLAATRSLAEKLAIAGTPTFVFGDRMVRGYLPLEQMRDLVGDVRAVN